MINRNFICIIGGAGHVGTPLGLALSSKGYNVILIDKSKENIKKINDGEMPFIEERCTKLLKKIVQTKFRRSFVQNSFFDMHKRTNITKSDRHI